MLLNVASTAPSGLVSQGGWPNAEEEIKAMLSRAREEEATPVALAERVGWIAARLLPWSAEQRQRLLQNNAPDMRAMALTFRSLLPLY
jgi:hypothetical protein